MSQENCGKCQRPFGRDNYNVKEENKGLEEKLADAEQRARIAKIELEKFIQKYPQQKEELANVIALLEGLPKETIDLDQMELTLKPEILHHSLDRHRLPLPLELNCQIFECLKIPIQKKFICGLGRGIYGIYRQKVLTKSIRLRNPEQNGWNSSNTNALISSNELQACDNTWQHVPIVLAKNGFPISGEHSRNVENFPGTILYYFEVTQLSEKTQPDGVYYIGFSDGYPTGEFGFTPNSYCMSANGIYYWLSVGGACKFEWPNGLNAAAERNGPGNVAGCGLVLNSANELSIFFTWNGIFLGKQMPISPSVDCLYLYPTIEISNVSVEANFGNDPAKPFEYNI